ncbi:hypothetical protein HPB51_018114 [Rhipicephalus microplus]|uniref:F-box domain-containing protein n=1 Tax=Rhipicephalus microplus TaxID=6941 RepID=A0A9J6E381_RHIMP|nr:hypothetical protein HPB51_018114 [Rhipicephalus microplus]
MLSKHKKESVRIQACAAAAMTSTVESLRPHQDGVLRLPDNVLGAILELLGWEQRLAVANTCQRLSDLVNGGPRIRSTTVLRLLKDKLRKLECLHWTVGSADDEVPAYPARDAEGSLRCDCSVMPPNLKTMYVEVVRLPENVNFVCGLLGHCHALRSLHCHERKGAVELSDSGLSAIEYRIFASYRDASGRHFQNFTYTTERIPSNDALLTRLKNSRAPQVNVFSALGSCVDVCGSIVVQIGPPIRNCVTLGELDSANVESTLSRWQLTILLDESGEDAITRLKNIWLGRKFGRLTSLTLMTLPESAAMFARSVRNQSCLCNFLRSCVALVELNFSSFHFSPHFNWSFMLATGGLHQIRSLALAACALCHPAHLRALARASFQLRELDVRSFPQDVNECKFCLHVTTCDDEALAPLCCLNHLETLTLCEMPHARSLSFLRGCASIRELRLRNVPVGSGKSDRDMEPLASIWPQLRVFKFESVMLVKDFHAFHCMPTAPTMKRLCLGAHFTDWYTRIDMGEEAGLLQKACPAVDVLHLHFYLSTRGDKHGFFPRRQLLEACDAPDIDDAAWLSTADKVWLCNCANYIGLIPPHGVK